MKALNVLCAVLAFGSLLHCQPAGQDRPPADSPEVAGSPITDPAEPSPGAKVTPSLQPYALSILKQMSDTLRSAQQFTFHAEGHDEEVIEDLGQKLRHQG